MRKLTISSEYYAFGSFFSCNGNSEFYTPDSTETGYDPELRRAHRPREIVDVSRLWVTRRSDWTV